MKIQLPPRNSDGSYTFVAGMAVDADGSPRAYGPPGTKPLDNLANAGQPGNWWGIVTDTGTPEGEPVVQKQCDPFPGYYVSSTSYRHEGFPQRDPRAWVDSENVIFIVLPSHWRKEAKGVVLGCLAKIRDKKTGNACNGVVADFGPVGKLGEASIAAAKFFGLDPSPKHGGTSEKRFEYTFHPGIAAAGFKLKPM